MPSPADPGGTVMPSASTPLVSVVIPTRGRPALLLRAIEGVLAQSVASLEVIAVIDGDDPATVAAVEAVADPRVRYLALAQSGGPGAARNAGVAVAKGEWVAFLDDDDEWSPAKLETQLAAAARAGDVGDRLIVMSRSRVITPEAEFIRPTEGFADDRPIDEWLFDRRSWMKGGQSFIQSSSLMAPRSLLLRAPFPSTRLHEDWEIVIDAIKQHGCRLVTAPEPEVLHYLHHGDGSLSRESNWRQSIAWLDGMGDRVTRRAYAGFCLTVVAQGVTRARAHDALWPLLSRAFGRGRPTAKQLFVYAMLWAFPDRLRRRVRAALQGERVSARTREA